MPTATALHAVHSIPGETIVSPGVTRLQLQESARYAVLRRLGSALRHQIAGSLQPVSMIASMVERRVQAEAPDLASLRKNCAEMSNLSRSASSECVALMGWLAPPTEEAVALEAAVEDCLHLLATEFSFRGFTIVNAVGSSDVLVSRTALRTLLPAMLMALSDAAGEPAQLQLSAAASGGFVTLSVAVSAIEGEDAPGKAKSYRTVVWDEVAVLAEAEAVAAKRTANGAQLTFQAKEPAPRVGAAEVRWG